MNNLIQQAAEAKYPRLDNDFDYECRQSFISDVEDALAYLKEQGYELVDTKGVQEQQGKFAERVDVLKDMPIVLFQTRTELDELKIQNHLLSERRISLQQQLEANQQRIKELEDKVQFWVTSWNRAERLNRQMGAFAEWASGQWWNYSKDIGLWYNRYKKPKHKTTPQLWDEWEKQNA